MGSRWSDPACGGRRAVERAQVFGLDHIETAAFERAEENDEFALLHRARLLVGGDGHQAAAPVVGAEGLRDAGRPATP
jgi:hypothetical protein